MSIDLSEALLIDNHAHSLAKRHMELDVIEFRRLFSESSSILVLENDVPQSLQYQHMLKCLRKVTGYGDEEELIAARQAVSAPDYVNQLWDDASIAALLIDDGFNADKNVSIAELGHICQRPIYRIVRIESVLENEILKTNSFDELESKFELSLLSGLQTGTVGLKTIAAYRGGLALESATQADAAKDFEVIRAKLASAREDAEAKFRVSRSPLYYYFLFKTFELAADHDLPVQIHTGFGDTDLQLDQANPSLLTPVFKDRRLARAKFVLLHCFPYVREASYLCSVFPNVYMDLSLSMVHASMCGVSMLYDALSLAAPTKVLMGTDGHTAPEMHWYGAISIKKSLTNFFNELIEDAYTTEELALRSAERMLFRNARELYDLEGLR
jgi:Predicted metal-dependent hydrolase of the TIM-barrel fold